MMYYIPSHNTDPYYNLALEQYVFDSLDREHSYFMLWQNANSIIIGKHQNTISEINAAYVRERDIRVARRLSGGGAVYHDLGNLNFTFIVDSQGEAFDFSQFCRPIQKALSSMGVQVEISGRNDMTIDGKKFSGNSQYMKKGRVMHHGTILYDTDMSVLSGALHVSKDKIESKGIKSVRSRVTNVKPYMKDQSVTTEQFWEALRHYMFQENDMSPYVLTPEDLAGVERLRDDTYATWEWNYGASPSHSIQKTRRIEGCGKLEVFIDVSKQGQIKDIAFYGDYFGNNDSRELAAILTGCKLEEHSLLNALAHVDLTAYFAGLDRESFLAVLLQ